MRVPLSRGRVRRSEIVQRTQRDEIRGEKPSEHYDHGRKYHFVGLIGFIIFTGMNFIPGA